MKKTISLLLVMLCLILTCCAAAEEGILTVAGSATVTLSPDLCSVQMGIETEADDVSEAQKENARITAQVIDALRAMGAGEKDLTTGSPVLKC